ncbi:MAG: DUF427 domain-containing protein [Pseudorhodobacter sp.]
MPDHIRLRKAGGTWVLRAGDAVLGESRAAVELSEGSRAPVIYFPRADTAMVFLDPSPRRSTCPHKGEAVYFSIVTPAGRIEDAAWSHESPPESLARIAGHLAFDAERVTVEQL